MTDEEILQILDEHFILVFGNKDEPTPGEDSWETYHVGGDTIILKGILKGKTYEIIIKNGHIWMPNCTVGVVSLPDKWPIFEEVRNFACNKIGIKTLEHAPKICKNELKVKQNPLMSLKGPKSVPHIIMSYHNSLPLLDLFHIEDLTKVTFDGYVNLDSDNNHDDDNTNKNLEEISKIIEKYLPLGIRGIAPCMFALRSEGFDGNARTTY